MLYVSPSGYFTLVETKLWKSSEARRQVVAQIIDYTRRIIRWDYTHLENAFLEYARQYGVAQRGLIPYVAEQSDEDLDEMAFTDAINRNLRLGRVLLLIVGDGIREGVEEMTAYLQDAPNLQFTLGLVEIGCYGVTAGSSAPSTLLVSRVVMRTKEVTRAIVQIEMSEEAARRVIVTTATPPEEEEATAPRSQRPRFMSCCRNPSATRMPTRREASSTGWYWTTRGWRKTSPKRSSRCA